MAKIREAASNHQMMVSGLDVIKAFLRGLANDELTEFKGKLWCKWASILSKGTAAHNAEDIEALGPGRRSQSFEVYGMLLCMC